jgi:hypothetical protein
MKGKLIKLELIEGYRLDDEKGNLIASTLDGAKTKLSKQNCDEIFGVVDVEKLAQDYANSQCEDLHDELGKTGAEWGWETALDFKNGFNKAMELNKDKQFTEDDLRKAIRFGFNGAYGYLTGEKGTIEKQSDNYILSIQQPTEIEVEIKMEPCFYDSSLGGFSTSYTEDKPKEQPKLDKDGCLILKKI